ncbi:hypothetical protein [Coralliovum pocilloporae]|uniref:hypothetical protein n=1 Tax=Coralliovum pocilloporae TaxID=3066369 RepID=UPI0033077840
MSMHDTLYTPTASRRPTLISSLFAVLVRAAKQTVRPLWNRRHLPHLETLDERMLQDIGLRPEDLAQARLSDLGTDPTTVLSDAARRNQRQSL